MDQKNQWRLDSPDIIMGKKEDILTKYQVANHAI